MGILVALRTQYLSNIAFAVPEGTRLRAKRERHDLGHSGKHPTRDSGTLAVRHLVTTTPFPLALTVAVA